MKLQGTRKIGCPAHLNIHTIELFPDFRIPAQDVGVRKLKEKKSATVKELKSLLLKHHKLKMVKKYFILLPTQEAHHQYHKTSGEAGFSQKMHPKLASKIVELVSEGATSTPEVKRALNRYVHHVLCPDQTILASNRAYFPTSTDIRNHIYAAQKAMELSKFDQDNLKLKIDQWEKDNPSSKFYFRAYKDCEKISAEEEEEELQFVSSQPLLYVHQEEWQQQLLKMYGNSITLMDATYKTTKYELPMFFVSVKTNVGYSVVADFIIQSETTEQIAEALKILTTWNPEWAPGYFMVDYSEAEISAIKNVFPQCKTYLCDFHREQCWERWVKERKHGLSSSDAETLLVLLRNCAWAPLATESGLSSDHYYREEVDKLKKSKIWSKNQQVREWLESKWFSIPQVNVL